MSPHIMIDLEELHKGLLALNREFHFDRHNNRPLVSRNKREGHYYDRHNGRYFRTFDKELGLRYRKQSGAQWLRVKR